MTTRLTVSILMIIVVLIWAASFILIRIALREIPPATLALARFSLATPILVGYTLVTRRDRNARKIVWKKEFTLFTALGLTGVTLVYVLEFYSLKFIGATAGSILINLNVIFATILSAAFLKESMTKRKTTGVLLAFTGVIILATEGKLSAGLRSFEPTGTLLMIGSAFCWAAYSILSKNTLKRHSAATSTSAAFCLGTLCLIPFSLAEASAKPLLSMSWLVWLSILYLAIPCSAIAYFLWNYLLEQVEVTKLAIWLYAIPIPTAIFSYIFLGERITESLVLGSFLVIVGIYLTES